MRQVLDWRYEARDYRQTVYEIAKSLAPGWERQRARIEEGVAPVREWMIEKLAPRPGDTVLELAAGAGDTGFEAAAMVGESGRLISTDFSPEMVEVARRRGAELGLRNVDYRVMDAEHIELDSGSVDGVLCRFGYMLMADPAAALAETRRVLRRNGRLALSVWGAPRAQPVDDDSCAGCSSSSATWRHRSLAAPTRSAWRARSARGRCSSGRASPRCARRRRPCALPSATSTIT